MNLDKNSLIGVAVGSATAALCSYAYYLYNERRKISNRRDKQCQVYQPTKRNSGTQVPRIATSNKDVQVRPLQLDKRVQFKLPVVSTSTQADLDSEVQETKDVSSHVSVADFGSLKSVASQTEEQYLQSCFVPSSDGLDDCDVFYDALESPSQEMPKYDYVVSKTSSIMGHLRCMMGPFQSLVEDKNTSRTSDRAHWESDVAQSTPQRSSIRNTDSLDDAVEYEIDDIASLF